MTREISPSDLSRQSTISDCSKRASLRIKPTMMHETGMSGSRHARDAVTEKAPHLIRVRIGNGAKKAQRRQLRQAARQAGVHLRRQPAEMTAKFLQRFARVQPAHRFGAVG